MKTGGEQLNKRQSKEECKNTEKGRVQNKKMKEKNEKKRFPNNKTYSQY